MSQFKKIQLAVCVAFLWTIWLPNICVLGQEITTQESTSSLLDETDPQNIPRNLITQLEALRQLNQYQVSYTLTNARSGSKMAKAVWQVDEQAGQAWGQFDFYQKGTKPDHYHLNMLSYDHFNLVYVDQFAYLQSMAFFDQKGFPPGMSHELEDYQNYYVGIDGDQLERVMQTKPLIESLLFLPDTSRLAKIDPQKVYHLNDWYLVSLNKLEIPDLLYDRAARMNLNYELNVAVDPTANTELVTDKKWAFQTKQYFSFDQDAVGANVALKIQSQLHPDLIKEVVTEGNQDEEANDFERDMAFQTRDMTGKLTKVNLAFNPQKQSYRVTIWGISENFNINIFESGTASFKSYDLKLEYEITPCQPNIPALEELKTISNREFIYVIDSILNKSSH
ncbi:hypothetical protein [Vaginisenegalia massiliensis]|uniref:hypothetical protein n=1 Tax=Vaginisenegalia massiliensis TaxID=2058294 RepID=UPI000F54BC99|nr:hypothetical protein [Vaginisenegalia massiliensis]